VNDRGGADAHSENMVEQLATDLHAVWMRGTRGVDQTRFQQPPLDIPELRKACARIVPSAVSGSEAIEGAITVSAAPCPNGAAILALFGLEPDDRRLGVNRSERRQRALELINKEFGSEKSQQDAIRGLRLELAEAIRALSVKVIQSPSESADAVSQANVARDDDAAALELLVGELEALCGDFGASIAKVRVAGNILQRLRATDYELQQSVRSSDRASAAYRVLNCASDTAKESATWAVLRGLLNFGASASQLHERRKLLACSMGLTDEDFERFARGTFEHFADYLVEVESSPCRSGGQPPFGQPEPPPPDGGELRRLLGLITLEQRPDHHARLILDFLDRVPDADAIVRGMTRSKLSPAEIYDYIMRRVLRARRLGSAKGDRRADQYYAKLSVAQPQAEIMVGLLPGSLFEQREIDEGLDEISIAMSLRMPPIGRSFYPSRKGDVLTRVSEAIELIDQLGEWAYVLRPEVARDHLLVLA